jgi:hypothetical protein
MTTRGTKTITFKALVRLEPRLLALLRAVKAEKRRAKHDPGYCANRTWFSRFEERLYRLIGWERRSGGPPELRTSEAYNLAVEELYEGLPDCRHGGPFCP